MAFPLLGMIRECAVSASRVRSLDPASAQSRPRECAVSALRVRGRSRMLALPELVVLAAVLKSSCLQGVGQPGGVDVEVVAQVVERGILVSQFHVDETEQHDGVRWNVWHIVDGVLRVLRAGEWCRCACKSRWWISTRVPAWPVWL